MSLLFILVCIILSEDFAVGAGTPPRDARRGIENNLPEGRAVQGRVKKHPIKALLLFKLLFFALMVPLSALTAKLISWNAFTMSLLALLTTKLLLLRTLFSEQARPTGMTGMPPIVIQSLPESPFGHFRLGSKILVQPETREDDGQTLKRWRNRQ